MTTHSNSGTNSQMNPSILSGNDKKMLGIPKCSLPLNCLFTDIWSFEGGSDPRKQVYAFTSSDLCRGLVKGHENTEHFGFICKEEANSYNYVGYIFKCESSSIATDAMTAITQVILNAESRPHQMIASCEHCPMVWYHKLCMGVENLTDRKTQATIFRKLEQLDEEEQSIIFTKLRGVETESIHEQNEFLMILLRVHCESKQGRHIHDTAENRSEFLSHYLGSSAIFTKAKRSLSNSFDQLLKRKASKDDFGLSIKGLNLPNTNNISRESSPNINNDMSDRESQGTRSRSSTISSKSDLTSAQHNGVNYTSKHSTPSVQVEKGPKSPMMDM